ncbi:MULTISPECIES: AMP-binding protein [unclassified Caulobacter]|jgi:crotonobetaine/carnitine-CoA ligase|uniref:AMP-binding protein n=1 Tax=unclassified Caulobacter TaxID=2648921 RepID=UPI000784C8E6|nr:MULTISPECIES: AMP-binding protein [unclassified Caulobacter]AZS19413.1 ATP-dependent acyl-CoA ligase [Caulobacter sp. FWC26]PIB90094.1 ATP-dependent acyl-CoA ligase [Caulobacter sp. FWC2]
MTKTIEAGWRTGPRDTPVAALRRAVAAHPDKVFLDFSGEKHTYAAFDLASNRFAHELKALGLAAGTPIVSMLDNNVDAVTTWIAANKISAISVPLNTALVGQFLRHQIEDAGALLLVCEARYLQRVLDIEDQLTALKTVLVRGAFEPAPGSALTIVSLDDHRGGDDSAFEDLPDPGALNALIYTSGTTGPSKGCMITGNQMCHFARMLTRSAPFGPDDIYWTPLPLFHMNAIATGVVSVMLVGATISFAPKFSVSGFWPAIEASGATVVSILGSLGTLLARAEEHEAMARCFGQVHTVKGNPFPEDIKQIWRERFGAKKIGSNVYGLTEGLLTSMPADGAYAEGSSGKAAPELDVRIFDDNDNEVPVGVSGEVVCRPLMPDIIFKGYWRRPEDTLKVMGNMWFHTGDIGRFDEDGFFYFVDRKKDYLRRRGENISSFEMETSILAHPAIEQVAVHAVPSKLQEDDLKVTAKLKPGAVLSEEALCRWLIERVPYYAVPRYIEFRAELPVNPQGRVLKFQLRDEGATPNTWDIETTDIKPSR